MSRILKGIAWCSAMLLISLGLSAVADAGSMHRGSTGGGAQVTGALPGQALWAYYTTTERGGSCYGSTPNVLCDVAGEGDNIVRLLNPNGSANPFLAGGLEHPVCAMIYVFDDDEEMGECCGCLVTSAGLLTLSVEKNLTSNWGLRGGPEGADHGNGVIAIVATAPNVPFATCNPTNVPGYEVTIDSNLLGSITHNQDVARKWGGGVSGLTEVGLYDNGGGDPANLTYLQNQCGVLIGNGTGGGVCNCPVE